MSRLAQVCYNIERKKKGETFAVGDWLNTNNWRVKRFKIQLISLLDLVPGLTATSWREMFRGGSRFTCRVFSFCTQFHEFILLWASYAMSWAWQSKLWQGVLVFQSHTRPFQSKECLWENSCGVAELISQFHTQARLQWTWINICSNSLLIFSQRAVLCAYFMEYLRYILLPIFLAFVFVFN